MFILVGTIFIGTTAVQGTVQIQAYEAVALFDFTRFNPGTSWISGNVLHVIDNINTFVSIVGPVEGDVFSYGTIMNINLATGKGVGSAFTEIVGTWIADDEFNGLPFYCYGLTILRSEGGIYTGTLNLLGTLGDYSIHLKGDFITGFNPQYGFCNIMSGEITIIS